MLEAESLTLAQLRGREQRYTECLLYLKHHTGFFFFFCFITLSLKIPQGAYNCPHVKNKKWKKNEENLNLPQKLALFPKYLLACALHLLFSLDGKVVAQILHDWHHCVICLIQIPWPWRAIFPVESWSRLLCPHQLLSIASFWVCAHFILRKYFVVYVLIAFYVFLFKVQAYEGRDLKYLIHFFISRA